MTLFSAGADLTGSILQYEAGKGAAKQQAAEFRAEMGFQREVEAHKEQDEQRELNIQKREHRQQLAVEQQGQREKALTTLRSQDITQATLNTELNNKYFHAQSQQVVRNLAAKLSNTAPVPRGGSAAFFNANKKLNEQAANQTLMKMQNG